MVLPEPRPGWQPTNGGVLPPPGMRFVRCPGAGMRCGGAINEWTACHDHANVVIVHAHQRLEQGNARPPICLPKGFRPGARFLLPGRKPPGTRQLSAAQNPGDTGLRPGAANLSAAAR
jgi:hypothetical protein